MIRDQQCGLLNKKKQDKLLEYFFMKQGIKSIKEISTSTL